MTWVGTMLWLLVWTCVQSLVLALPPLLTSWDANLSTGRMTFTFDQPIVRTTFRPSLLELQSASGTETFQLHSSYDHVQRNQRITFNENSLNLNQVSLLLTSNDYAELVLFHASLTSSPPLMFLTVQDGLIQNTIGENNLPLDSTTRIPINQLVSDTLSPSLLSFSIDLSTCELLLSFSEPVDVQSFTIDGIVLQPINNMALADTVLREEIFYLSSSLDADDDTVADDDALVVDSMQVLQVSDLSRSLLVYMGAMNCNGIRVFESLGKTKEMIHMSLTRPIINDLAGNPLTIKNINTFHALSVTDYLPDITQPSIVSWDLDIQTGQLWLYFSKTVKESTLNPEMIWLTNQIPSALSPLPLKQVAVRDWTLVPSHFSTVLCLYLTEPQLDEVKGTEELCDEETNCFLVLGDSVIFDTARPANTYNAQFATWTTPLLVNMFHTDISHPRLDTFDLNLQTGLLTLYFNETVSIGSIDGDGITLQSHQQFVPSTESITLGRSRITVLSDRNVRRVEIQLSLELVNEIQLLLQLGRSITNTFIWCTSWSLYDTSRNMLIPSYPSRGIGIQNLIPDDQSGQLLRWSMNLLTRRLTLFFSKPVELISLKMDHLRLVSSVDESFDRLLLNLEEAILLTPIHTDGGSSSRIPLSSSLEFELPPTLRDSLQSYDDFCSTDQNCYLIVDEGFAQSVVIETETSRIYVATAAVPETSPIDFVADSQAPTVSTWDLNLRDLSITLRFTKPVKLGSLRSDLLALGTLLDNLSLGAYSGSPLGFASTFELKLTQYDMIRLQSLPVWGTPSEVLLIWNNGFVINSQGHAVQAGRLRVSGVVDDDVPPRIIGVYLDPTAQLYADVYFSELMRITPMNVTQFSAAMSSTIGSTLRGATVQAMNTVQVGTKIVASQFRLSVALLKPELSARSMFISQETTRIYVSGPSLAQDSSPLKLSPLQSLPSNAIAAGGSFLSFRLDMSNRILQLEQSFALDLPTFSPSNLILRTVGKSSQMVRLSTSVLVTGGNQLAVVTISLSDLDAAEILANVELTSPQSVELLVEIAAFRDVHGRPLVSNHVVKCLFLMPDDNVPHLSSYLIDLVSGRLVMNFDKYLDLNTVQPPEWITLETPDGSSSLDFSRAVLLTEDSLAKVLTYDLNIGFPLTLREEILLAYPLGTEVAQTTLSLPAGFAWDNALLANPMPPVVRMSTTQILRDQVAPSLESFGLDLSRRVLTLNFTEAISVSGFQLSKLTLTSSQLSSQAITSQLTSSTMGSLAPTRSVEIILGSEDVDTIVAQYPNLAASLETTLLSIDVDAGADLATPPNAVAVVLPRFAVTAASYVPDTESPVLNWFELNMETARLRLGFNELVQCSTFIPEAVVFQSRQLVGKTPGMTKVSLTRESWCVNDNESEWARELEIALGDADIKALLLSAEVAKTAAQTFLTLQSGAVLDVAGNPSWVRGDGNAMAPRLFIGDSTPPQLAGWKRLRTEDLEFHFSESIRTVDLSKFVLSTSMSADNPLSLSKCNLLSTSLDRTVWKFKMPRKFIAPIIDHLYIHVLDAGAYDMSGNAMHSITPLRMGPTLLTWDLDLTVGQLRLIFSEPVAPFGLSGLLMQNAQLVSDVTASVALTTSEQDIIQINDREWLVTLSSEDMSEIKTTGVAGVLLPPYPIYLLPMIASWTHSLDPSAEVADMTVVPNHYAAPIRYLIGDKDIPTATGFVLDMSSLELQIAVSEPVQVTDLSGITLFSPISGQFLILSPDSISTIEMRGLDLVLIFSPEGAARLQHVVAASGPSALLDGLVLLEGALQDMSANRHVGTTPEQPLPMLNFIPDTQPPTLLLSRLDVATGQLLLRFDEATPVEDFRSGLASVQLATSESTDTSPYMINPAATIFLTDISERDILIELDWLGSVDGSWLDLQNAGKCLSAHECFVQVNGVKDYFGNTAPSLPAPGVFAAVEEFVLPVYGAGLVQTSVRVEPNGDVVVRLTFDQLLSTASCTDFSLSSSAAWSTDIVLLDDTICTASVMGEAVELTVTPDNLPIGSTGTKFDTYVRIVPVDSIAGPLTKTVFDVPIAVSGPFPSLTVLSPQFVRSSLDLNSGIIRLVFTAPVSGASIQPNEWQFSSPTGSVTLTEPTAFVGLNGDPSTTLQAILSEANLISLKMANFPSDSTSLSLNVILSTVNGPQSIIGTVRIDPLVPDDVPPTIRGVKLDMNDGLLYITFDEPILPASIDLAKFLFVPTPTSTTGRRLHSHGVGISQPNILGTYFSAPIVDDLIVFEKPSTWQYSNQLLTVNLSRYDHSSLATTPDISTSLVDSLLYFEFGAFSDYAGNYIASTPQTLETYVPDTLPPHLITYSLNYSRVGEPIITSPTTLEESLSGHAVFTFYFSEAIRVDLLQPTLLSIQSRYLSSNGILDVLTSGNIFAGPSKDTFEVIVGEEYALEVLVTITPEDLLRIQLTDGLLRDRSSTFVGFPLGWTTDSAGNLLRSAPDGAVHPVDLFVMKRHPPVVSSAALNLRDETLSLMLEEPVYLTTGDVSGLTLAMFARDVAWSLVRNEIAVSALSAFVDNDTQMKLTEVLSSLSVAGEIATVSTLTALLPVDVDGVLASFTLTSTSSAVAIPDPPVSLSSTFLISLGADDLDSIRLLYPLASSASLATISYTPVLLTDFLGLPIAERHRSDALIPTEFTADQTDPAVVNAALDMRTGNFSILLSEAVSVDSILIRELALQSATVGRLNAKVGFSGSVEMYATEAVFQYAMATNNRASNVAVGGRLLHFVPSPLMSAEFKLLGIGLDLESSWLSWSDSLLHDYAGNPIQPAWDGSVTNRGVSDYTIGQDGTIGRRNYGTGPYAINSLVIDNVPPVIQSWQLLLPHPENRTVSVPEMNGRDKVLLRANEASLVISFDEPVKLVHTDRFALGILDSDGSITALMNAADGVSPTVSSSVEAGITTTTTVLGSTVLTSFTTVDNVISSSVVMQLLPPGSAVTLSRYQTMVTISISNFCLDGTFEFYSTVDVLGQVYSCTNRGGDFFSWLENIDMSRLRLIPFVEGGVVDVSSLANPLAAQSFENSNLAKPPICDVESCSEGQYISTPCTLLADRVCEACTQCTNSQWLVSACSGLQDTSCAECSACLYGQYASTACSKNHDTICSTCSQCPPMSYAVQQCIGGEDVVCSSCEMCEFDDATASKTCTSQPAYLEWRKSECCTHPDTRRMVRCKELIGYKTNNLDHRELPQKRSKTTNADRLNVIRKRAK